MFKNVSLNSSSDIYDKKVGTNSSVDTNKTASDEKIWDKKTASSINAGNEEDELQDVDIVDMDDFFDDIKSVEDTDNTGKVSETKRKKSAIEPDEVKEVESPDTGVKMRVEIKDSTATRITTEEPPIDIERLDENTLQMDDTEFTFDSSEQDKNGNTIYTYNCEGKKNKILFVKYATGTMEYRVCGDDGLPEKSVVIDKDNNPAAVKKYHYKDNQLSTIDMDYCNQNLSQVHSYGSGQRKTKIENYKFVDSGNEDSEGNKTKKKELVSTVTYDYEDGKKIETTVYADKPDEKVVKEYDEDDNLIEDKTDEEDENSASGTISLTTDEDDTTTKKTDKKEDIKPEEDEEQRKYGKNKKTFSIVENGITKYFKIVGDNKIQAISENYYNELNKED